MVAKFATTATIAFMKYFAGFFSLLGLALHYRRFGFFGDLVLRYNFKKYVDGEAEWSDRLLALTAPWTPYIFYFVCFAFCFVTFRNRITTAVLFGAMLFCFPYWISLYELEPSTARIALYAGGGAFFLPHHSPWPEKDGW